MATATKPSSPFGQLLRDILDEKGITIRELSRRMVDDPGDFTEVESKRRMLQRYLRGDVTPNARVRQEIADGLAEPRERLAEDREQEQQRRRVIEAITPLADALLDIARDTAKRGREC